MFLGVGEAVNNLHVKQIVFRQTELRSKHNIRELSSLEVNSAATVVRMRKLFPVEKYTGRFGVVGTMHLARRS